MTNRTSRALRPVETEPGVVVHPRTDRDLATSQWLLCTLPEGARGQARDEWTDHKLALLPLGTLFSAVRLPGRLVLAAGAIRAWNPVDVDAFLHEALEGGPVICDPHRRWYYALVPGRMPEKWHAAREEWQALGVECLGRGTYLGVPRVDVTGYDPQAPISYWSVMMPSAAMLCTPLNVARVIAAGQMALGEDADV